MWAWEGEGAVLTWETREGGQAEKGHPGKGAPVREGGGAGQGALVREGGRAGQGARAREGDQAGQGAGVREGDQAGQGAGAPNGHVHLMQRTVHRTWHIYLIAPPRRRGPHRCDGVYLLQYQCSNPLVRSHWRADVWGHVSLPFVQPSPSMISDWAGCSPYWAKPENLRWKQGRLSKYT